ncbi:MAG TPA: kelch repeat-containing protein, partial [Polyangia bacterium]|nr:kelch repeat-containing protein [Polyangia bacterium]
MATTRASRFAAIAALMLAGGCGGDDDFAVTLLRSPVVAEDPLAGVDTLELRLPTGVTKVPWHDRTTTGYKARLPSVAAGAQLTVAAVSGGQVVAAGRSAPLAADAHAATVYLGLVDQFADTPTAPPLADARFGATATLLADGRVLVVGGATAGGPRTPVPSSITNAVTLYDPARGSFSDAGDASFAARIFHAVVADAGGAFVFGGLGAGGGLSDIVRFDAAANTLSALGDLPSPRWAAASAPIAGEGLLLIGGYTSAATLATDALVLRAGAVAATVPLPAPRAFATAVALANGDVLVTGGLDAGGYPLPDALLYSAAANAFVALTATGDARATRLSA